MASAEYDLRTLKAPVLGGWLLWAFVRTFIDTPLWNLISEKMFVNSGVVRALRERRLPEAPAYGPNVATSADSPGDCINTATDIVVPRNPEATAHNAAALCPSWDRSPSSSLPASPERLAFRPRIKDFYDAYSSGRCTPTAVIADTLKAVRESEAMNPPMRFFIAIDEAEVTRQANESSARWQLGRPLSLMDGVPIAVKDDTDQLPYKTSLGTSFMADIRPVTRDAQHVEALRAAGAILLGKANMHEIGQGITGWNAHHGPARNPYSPSHFTGGSSSGTAALVASGLCPVAIGCDGGGSIRIPAAFCGVYGLMPTFGRTREEHKGPKTTGTVGTTGPIAGCTEDLAIVYSLTANLTAEQGSNQCPPLLTLPAKLPDTGENFSMEGMRLGVYKEWFEHAEPSIVKVCYQALDALQSMGAEVVHITIPELEAARVAHACIISSEMNHFYSGLMRGILLWYKFGLDIRVSQRASGKFTAADVMQSQQIRARTQVFFSRVFKTVDIIVTPSTAITAPAVRTGFGAHLGESNLPQLSQVMRFATPANLLGYPAISVPVGLDENRLPVGLQLMGRPWSEATLIDCARKLELLVEPLGKPAVALGVLV